VKPCEDPGDGPAEGAGRGRAAGAFQPARPARSGAQHGLPSPGLPS